MKKLAIAAICAALALALTGCASQANATQFYERFTTDCLSTYYFVITDEETGVQYLEVRRPYGAAITPLLNSDGTPYVDGE